MNGRELDVFLRKPRPREQNTVKFLRGVVGIQQFYYDIPPMSSAFSIQLHDRYVTHVAHGHDFLECMYIYDGTVVHEVNGETITMRKDDFLFFAPGTVHSISPCGADDIGVNFIIRPEVLFSEFKYVLAGLPPTLLSFFTNASEPYLLISAKGDSEIRDLCVNMLCETLDPDGYTPNILCLQLGVLLHRLARRCQNEQPKIRESMPDRLEYVLRHIERNFNDVTLESAAKRFGYTPNYLSAMLKNATGKNFTSLRNDYRMLESAVLLKNTNFSIRKIAADVGISNASHFYRKFRAQFHMSPAEYRRSLILEGQD